MGRVLESGRGRVIKQGIDVEEEVRLLFFMPEWMLCYLSRRCWLRDECSDDIKELTFLAVAKRNEDTGRLLFGGLGYERW
jgi:hypothetical protein